MKKVLLALAMVLAVAFNLAWGSGPTPVTKVLIVPPILYGSTDMLFLQQAVVNLLTTRLAKPGKLVILEPPRSETDGTPETQFYQADALAEGRNRGADYVIFGSLTVLGSSVSTDLRILALADEQLALVFSRSGNEHADLFTHMDQFAAEANQKVFGFSKPAAAKAATTPAVPSASTPVDIHQHPEKLLDRPMPDQTVTGKGPASADSVSVVTDNQAIIKGPSIQDQIQGVAIGDLTGDGHMECVYTGRNSVWIYRYADGRFAKMAHIEERGNHIGVDTADLDGDGCNEIFVTNVDRFDGRLISYVLAYNGKVFEHRAKRLDYYFRAINLPGRGRVLLGQRQGANTIFAQKIFEIKYQSGKYCDGKPWKAPRQFNIFGLGMGKFFPEGSAQLVAFTESRHLQLLNPNGDEVWRSAENFGGTCTLVQRPDRNNPSNSDSRFLPARIEVLDVDKDRADEVVVMRNDESIGNIMSRSRMFKKGRMEVLKLHDSELVASWHTRFMTELISDFAVNDLDGDGQVEIVAAVIEQRRSILEKAKSRIYVFHLQENTNKAEHP